MSDGRFWPIELIRKCHSSIWANRHFSTFEFAQLSETPTAFDSDFGFDRACEKAAFMSVMMKFPDICIGRLFSGGDYNDRP